jgi:RHS repeat-associated protein
VHFAYKFTGKERDTESGLDYFGARYYASSMGRWMSPDWSAKQDPVPYAKLDDPQSLNLYGYMLNNPLGGADADGHDPWLSSEARLAVFRLFHQSAAAGIGRFDSTGGSNNISTHAGWVAIHTGLSKVAIPELSAQSHSGDDWGSERNAVRHVLWQADITKQFGADIATQAGNAHEQNPDAQLGSDFRTFPNSLRGLEAADQSVDLLNNQIGRSLGSSMTGNPVDDVTSVLNYYHNVGLYQVVPNGNDYLSVQQVRLSDADYNKAMSNVQQMQGPNGSIPQQH